MFRVPGTDYINHVATSPAVAAKMAIVVIQPRMFIPRVFTRLPMIFRLLVINMMSNSSGGVEKPCTISRIDQRLHGGLKPRKLRHIAITVNTAMHA